MTALLSSSTPPQREAQDTAPSVPVSLVGLARLTVHVQRSRPKSHGKSHTQF